MIIKKLHIFLLLTFLISSAGIFSQDYISPVNIPLSLSANFGELRSNHFHSGLDIRTQQVVNKPVFTVDDGFVSRIGIAPGGYGLALYIDHPSGYTSVYGHLNSFSKKIADYAKQKQYENETFEIDIKLKPNEIPVKKGEQIALSGNTGGSGGPHLHFEIRDTKSEDIIDPFNFIGKKFNDTLSPEIRLIGFYPIDNKGVVDNDDVPVYRDVTKTKSGAYGGLGKAVYVWGKIGIGVKAVDRMNGSTFRYGAKKIRLYEDNKLIFSSDRNRFNFDDTKMINSFIDYRMWKKFKSYYMKSFVEPGNTLPIYETSGKGYIDINQERAYQFKYELEDYFGNKTSYSFTLIGKKQNIPSNEVCEHAMFPAVNSGYYSSDFTLNIPIGNLYTKICYTHGRSTTTKYYSDIQKVNNGNPVPLDDEATVWIKANKKVDNELTSKLGIVEIDKNGKQEWIGGTYKNGGVEGKIEELGDNYAIDIDTVEPEVSPLNPEQWVKNRKIAIKAIDSKSDIASFRGEIDGKFALFTHDVRSDYYYYSLDD